MKSKKHQLRCKTCDYCEPYDTDNGMIVSWHCKKFDYDIGIDCEDDEIAFIDLHGCASHSYIEVISKELLINFINTLNPRNQTEPEKTKEFLKCPTCHRYSEECDCDPAFSDKKRGGDDP